MSTRRGWNEGSIRQRQDGLWEARIRLPNGARRSLYGATRREVATRLRSHLNDVARGIPLADDRMTVHEFLEQWLNSVTPSLRPATARHYHGISHHHLIPVLGRIRLSRLSPLDVQTLLGDRLDSGLSPRSVFHIRAVLRTALNHAMRWELIPRNVAQLASPPKLDQRAIQPLRPNEATTLLGAAKGTELEPVLTLALGLGLRMGEILGLRWCNLDFQHSTINIDKSLQRIADKYQLLDPKTERSRRTLPMPDFVAYAIQKRRIMQIEERLRAGLTWNEAISDLVFTTQLGAPRNNSSINHEFHRLLDNTGLPRRSFHSLRHSAATFLLASGIDLKTVSSILGHSQISLTANTYASVIPALQKEAMNRMDALFRDPR